MPARKKTPAQMEGLTELLASLTPAQREALGLPNTPAKEEAKVPFLSCWTASRVNANAQRVFSHTSKKGGGATKKYQILTRDEAHAMMDANLDNGRVYAIPVA